MPAPATITVQGLYYDPDGQPATGYVTLRPVGRFVNGSDVISSETLTFPLVNGAVSAAVAASSGNYEVAEVLDHAPVNVFTIPGASDYDLSGGVVEIIEDGGPA